MEIRENIMSDYNDANKNNYKLLKFALSELLDKTYKVKSNHKIFDIIENMIDERAQKIMRNKRSNVETDAYLMNIYNLYLTKLFFHKRRELILVYDENEVVGNSFDRKTEIEPKVIIYRKKRNFLNFFKKRLHVN